MTRIYYISHPQVHIDPHTPVPQWGLSDTGRARALAAAQMPWVQSIATFVSSGETKAIETMDALIGPRMHCERIVREDAHENDRSATGFIPPDQFEGYADRFFSNPDISIEGWETARDAQSRIVRVVEDVLANQDPTASLAFVGHGGVGTLLLCHLLNAPIARMRDQPAGGGNVFAFDSGTRIVQHGWKAMEDVSL